MQIFFQLILIYKYVIRNMLLIFSPTAIKFTDEYTAIECESIFNESVEINFDISDVSKTTLYLVKHYTKEIYKNEKNYYFELKNCLSSIINFRAICQKYIEIFKGIESNYNRGVNILIDNASLMIAQYLNSSKNEKEIPDLSYPFCEFYDFVKRLKTKRHRRDEKILEIIFEKYAKMIKETKELIYKTLNQNVLNIIKLNIIESLFSMLKTFCALDSDSDVDLALFCCKILEKNKSNDNMNIKTFMLYKYIYEVIRSRNFIFRKSCNTYLDYVLEANNMFFYCFNIHIECFALKDFSLFKNLKHKKIILNLNRKNKHIKKNHFHKNMYFKDISVKNNSYRKQFLQKRKEIFIRKLIINDIRYSSNSISEININEIKASINKNKENYYLKNITNEEIKKIYGIDRNFQLNQVNHDFYEELFLNEDIRYYINFIKEILISLKSINKKKLNDLKYGGKFQRTEELRAMCKSLEKYIDDALCIMKDLSCSFLKIKQFSEFYNGENYIIVILESSLNILLLGYEKNNDRLYIPYNLY